MRNAFLPKEASSKFLFMLQGLVIKRKKNLAVFSISWFYFCKYEELQLWKKLKIYVYISLKVLQTYIVYSLHGTFEFLVLFSDWLIQIQFVFKWDSISFFPCLINFFFIKILIFVCGLMLWVLQILFLNARLLNKIVFVISLVLDIYNYCVIINKNI